VEITVGAYYKCSDAGIAAVDFWFSTSTHSGIYR